MQRDENEKAACRGCEYSSYRRYTFVAAKGQWYQHWIAQYTPLLDGLGLEMPTPANNAPEELHNGIICKRGHVTILGINLGLR